MPFNPIQEDVMKHRSRWLLAILIPACLQLASCKPATEAAAALTDQTTEGRRL